MMKNYYGKIAFVVAIVVVGLISRAIYPGIYAVPEGSSNATTSSSVGIVPQFILPALTLTSVPSETTSSVSPGGDLESGSGAVSDGAIPDGATGETSVVPLGPVPDSVFSRSLGMSPPSLDLAAALVADAETGARFMSFNATKRWPLASVTKLMTATVALDVLSPVQKITITQDAFAVDPSEKTLHVGDTYTVTDLLRILLLPSSNVAAEALADAYGRGQFIAEMNRRAVAWGMENTHYDDPSGLSVGSQSTAGDLAVLAQKIYTDYPSILAITRTPQVTVTEISSGSQVVVKNINEFSGQSNFVGGKTGYTDQADGNLLSVFSDAGHPIVVIVLGTSDDSRFANTQALYDWFTANFKI